MADIGGFKDGILMIFGSLFTAYNSQCFTLDLNKSLFKVQKSGTKTNRSREQDNSEFDGERMINTSDLKTTL